MKRTAIALIIVTAPGFQVAPEGTVAFVNVNVLPIDTGRRAVFHCSGCKHQVSIFESAKLPLTKLFLAMYLHSPARNGISGPELGRQVWAGLGEQDAMPVGGLRRVQ